VPLRCLCLSVLFSVHTSDFSLFVSS
jgi:hypothetical protein